MFIYSASCLGGIPIPTGCIGLCAFVLFMLIVLAQFAFNFL